MGETGEMVAFEWYCFCSCRAGMGVDRLITRILVGVLEFRII